MITKQQMEIKAGDVVWAKIPRSEDKESQLQSGEGVVIRVLRIIKQAIESITGLMSNNEFITDDITINVNPELYPNCVRDVRNNLIIDKEAVIDLIDGMHQYISMTEVKDLNPDWDYNTEVRIVAFKKRVVEIRQVFSLAVVHNHQ